ncbi:MAG: phage virion morphogenesis protein [Rhizobiales bacterium]|nr:phage virion morphogenesis protein [Hyphomicrobiales bacterium]
MTALFTLDARLEGLEAVDAALARLDPIDGQSLLEGLGRMIQEQTRRRIISEKRGPDGKAWQPNRAGTSTLFRSGTLARSGDYSATAETAIVGSGLIYAGVHQRGATITPKQAKRLVFRVGNRTIFARKVTIPPRPYLGISSENGDDILDAVLMFLRRVLGGGR